MSERRKTLWVWGLACLTWIGSLIASISIHTAALGLAISCASGILCAKVYFTKPKA